MAFWFYILLNKLRQNISARISSIRFIPFFSMLLENYPPAILSSRNQSWWKGNSNFLCYSLVNSHLSPSPSSLSLKLSCFTPGHFAVREKLAARWRTSEGNEQFSDCSNSFKSFIYSLIHFLASKRVWARVSWWDWAARKVPDGKVGRDGGHGRVRMSLWSLFKKQSTSDGAEGWRLVWVWGEDEMLEGG